MRVLILRGGALGDFIMTLPALQAIREADATGWITVIGYPHIAGLAQAGGLADEVRSLDEVGMARFFSWKPEFTEEQVAFVSSFDLVISYLHDPGDIVRRNLLQAGARKVIYASPIIGGKEHAVEQLLRPVVAAGFEAAAREPALRLDEEAHAAGRKWLAGMGLSRGVVALHPGSGSPRKNWPVAGYARLARMVEEDLGRDCFFIIGEADGEQRRRLAELAPGVAVLENRTLLEVASVLAVCRAYVGNDSGITHLAAALGLRVTALFGPSDAGVWGPRGEHVRVLQAAGGELERISVDEVLAGLE